MTVKSGASRVGHLYAVWPLPRRGGDFSMKKKKMEFLSKPIWTCLTLYLSLGAGLHQVPASLRRYLTCNQTRKKYFFPKHESKATYYSQAETDHLFISIALPNFSYALSVYGVRSYGYTKFFRPMP